VELVDRLTNEFVTTDAIQYVPGMPDIEPGPAGQKAFIREMIATNPDFHISIDDMLIGGDKVAVRDTYHMNNPTTGAVESSVSLEIDRLVDGKIAESWFLMVPGNW
jgi:predicted SnoaL-like aldol condensation-catalyzing enzyme